MVILLIALAIISYTAFSLFVSKAGGKIDDSLAATIFNGIGAAIPFVIYFFLKTKSQSPVSKEGIIYSVLAGISIAIFAILLTNIFSRAENVSFVIPAIYGGTIVLAALSGVLIFKESISAAAMAGIAFITIGVCILVYSRLAA